jgi:hypothetical protein
MNAHVPSEDAAKAPSNRARSRFASALRRAATKRHYSRARGAVYSALSSSVISFTEDFASPNSIAVFSL